MKKITELTDLRGSTVIVRASLNVPVVDGRVMSAYRIMRALPTLRYLHECGAKIILIAHIGRNPEDSLLPVCRLLETHLPVKWGGVINEQPFIDRLRLMSPGDILMAENLRQDPREKTNDEGFAHEIAALGDIYVNDAFANIHREHASMSALTTLLPAYAGLNLTEEISNLQEVMIPTAPSLFMLGGAKATTKFPLAEKYLSVYDHIFIGGALANDIFKARGYEIGTSLYSEALTSDSPLLSDEKVLLPIDVIVDGPNGVRTVAPNEVSKEEKILDAGPATTTMLEEYIKSAKTILWNGPFGDYEHGFVEATETTVKMIADSDSFSVIGGGDTVASIERLGQYENFGFVSTGGGAMLTYLKDGTTPVLDLLK